ncbi:endonuclease/exonuclease/phosphatase family protein [Falsiroseomonas selenitidurans]|uniref:EEP domain-containing protein n=1 Tax=Falsiroseomonas selenitidurans TaxID=2716335 RepID=A0ABX1DWS8_9PROT|nr:endonuclease/exonuclease/phosphatase family protein [Falsiroseomonas selenitidurans]NKC29360.1 EEP domain-containing protein [Falsiroseomonas selenitidurans]
MRVASWNIHRGRGSLAPFRPDRIAAVLAALDADLIALQEAQHFFARRRPMLAEASLAEAGLVPLRVVADQQGWRSGVVLLRQDRLRRASARGVPLGGWEPRGAICAEIDLGEGPFRLLAAHLSLTGARRAAQARLLLDAAFAPPALPVLLLGDLNEWRAQGAALAVLAARFDLPAPVPTFPAFRPCLALDRILASPSAMLSGLRVHDTPAARRASDHLPLVAEVTP